MLKVFGINIFSIEKKYVLYTWFNVDSYGRPLSNMHLSDQVLENELHFSSK